MINYETQGQRAYRLRREAQERKAPPCAGEECQGKLVDGGFDVYYTEKGVWKRTAPLRKGKLCRACADKEVTRRNQEARESQRLRHGPVQHSRIEANIHAGVNGLMGANEGVKTTSA
jgi:hypothetical protein